MWHGKQHRGAMRDRKQEKREQAAARDARSNHSKLGRRWLGSEAAERILRDIFTA